MSSSSTPRQDDPWYRVVRCLVLLLVASLERKIARLLARMDALPEDARWDAEFERLDAQCAYLERVRDRFLAWLEDPSVELPRLYAPHERPGRVRWARVRTAGARAVARRLRAISRGRTAPKRAPPGGGRCTTTSLLVLDRPAWCAGAAKARGHWVGVGDRVACG